MQKAEVPKVFRLNLTTEELEFLLQIMREEEFRLLVERYVITKELSEHLNPMKTALAVIDMLNDFVTNSLTEDVIPSHERERKLKAEKYVREARLGVIQGFIKRFERLLDGTLRRGGRLSWESVEGRALLTGTADGTRFKRRIWGESK